MVRTSSEFEFAKSLLQASNLAQWKKAYALAKKSHVVIIVITAAIAPILLKILGERNFLLYIYALTRASKGRCLVSQDTEG